MIVYQYKRNVTALTESIINLLLRSCCCKRSNRKHSYI